MKKNYTLLFLALILVSVFIFPSGVFAKQKVIGVTAIWMGNDWNIYCSGEIKKSLEAKGYKVIHSNAEGQTRKQVMDTENFMQRKVDGIIIAGGEGPAFIELSKKIKAAGIPLVAVDMVLPGAISGVYADNYSGGTQMGIFLSTKMKGEGKVIVLDTPGWHSLLIRARMAQATFEEFPGIEVLNTFEVGVDDPVGNAYRIVKSTIRKHPDLKGIITTWDMPTVGAIKAVKEMGKTKQIIISAADPGKPLLAEMAKPDAPVMMVMGQNARVLGQLAAEFMDRALTQGVDSVPLSVFGPTYFISNGDPAKDFSNLTPMTPGQCWDIYHYDTKRPF